MLTDGVDGKAVLGRKLSGCLAALSLEGFEYSTPRRLEKRSVSHICLNYTYSSKDNQQ
jgi:hypothetical protein